MLSILKSLYVCLKVPVSSGSSVSGETSWSGSSSPNNWLQKYGYFVIKPFPNKPQFLCACSTSHLKTLW